MSAREPSSRKGECSDWADCEGGDLLALPYIAQFHSASSDLRIVFIQGIIDRLVKDFGLILKRVVVYQPGVSGTTASSAEIPRTGVGAVI